MDLHPETKIFVTGGTGLLGSYVLRYLVAAGFKYIHALRRHHSPMELVSDAFSHIQWHEGNILDPVLLEELLEGIDIVFHIAGKVSHEDRDYNRLMEVNVTGTKNIVDACMYAQVKRLVHISSVAALGRFANKRDYDEQFLWANSPYNSGYAISKMLAEQEVWRGIAEGLDAVILNPAQVIGGGFWSHGTGRLFEHVWFRRPFYPRGSTGWIDARDAARYTILAASFGESGQRYILSNEHIDYASMFSMIAAALGKPAPKIASGPLTSAISWRLQFIRQLLTGMKPDVTRISALNSARHYKYHGEKLFEKLPPVQKIAIRRTIIELSKLYIFCRRNEHNHTVLPLNYLNDIRPHITLSTP